MPCLEITEVILVYCNILNNNYQQNSRVLYTFVRNKFFGQLLEISSKNFIFWKTFHVRFSYITDENSHPLEIEDKIDLTLVIK